MSLARVLLQGFGEQVRVGSCKSMKSERKTLSKRCCCVGNVEWLIIRKWHTVGYYSVEICGLLHVLV